MITRGRILLLCLYYFKSLSFLTTPREKYDPLFYEVVYAAGFQKIVVYKKDLSEYCRRQVAPSLMLGRHSIEASTMTLQLSRLELPYTCYMSVRTESGNGIILVVQSDEMSSTCRVAGDQLVVYHMEDTFGGYRGPIQGSYTDFDKNFEEVFYTLQPKPSEPASGTPETESKEVVKSDDVQPRETTTQRDEIVMEVPLVNVSGYLVDSERLYTTPDTDVGFDMLYDVAPGPGIKYDTSIMPLVWFSLSSDKDSKDYDYGQRRYQLDYNSNKDFINTTLVTKDRFSMKNAWKEKMKVRNPRPYFEEITQTFDTKTKHTKTPNFSRQRHYKKQKYHKSDVTFVGNQVLTTGTNTNSWVNVINLMKKMNKSTEGLFENENYVDVSQLLQKLSHRNHNLSIYLETIPDFSDGKHSVTLPTRKNAFKLNISSFRRTPLKYTGKSSPEMLLNTYYKTVHPLLSVQTMVKENTSLFEVTKTTEKLKFETSSNEPLLRREETTNNRLTNVPNRKILSSVVMDEGGIKNQETVTSHITNETNNSPFLFTGSNPSYDVTKPLVDHESWENVVKAAPEMAMVLNSTSQNHSTVKEANKIRGKKRRKRYIESVPLILATPHALSTRRKYTHTAATIYNDFLGSLKKNRNFDIPEVLEPEYDEKLGRVDMHYWSDWAGPVIYNICHHYTGTKNKYRQSVLLNTSRIMIAVSNFSMKSLLLIVTTTRILMGNDSQCPASHVECQVTGLRVCIEASCACDGIPNCGSYEIYDEDRLHCSKFTDDHHNVLLAAFTFIAVILTILYSVYYWIKRCVPRVSEAFFVYTEDGDNVLYLDSVMRSPLDDEPVTMQYHGKFEDDYITEERPKKTFLKKIWYICSFGFLRKRTSSDEAEQTDPMRKMFSFTEFEINKMVGKLDTGDSLEMENLYKIDKKQKKPTQAMDTIQEHESLNDINKLTLIMEPTYKKQKYASDVNASKELNTLTNPPDTIQSKSLSSFSLSESEMNNDLFTHGQVNVKSNSLQASSSIEILEEPPKQSTTQTKKRLRFEEQKAPSIPTVSPLPRTVSLATGKTKPPIDHQEAGFSNLGRDLKRFFPGLKKKKSVDKNKLKSPGRDKS